MGRFWRCCWPTGAGVLGRPLGFATSGCGVPPTDVDGDLSMVPFRVGPEFALEVLGVFVEVEIWETLFGAEPCSGVAARGEAVLEVSGGFCFWGKLARLASPGLGFLRWLV